MPYMNGQQMARLTIPERQSLAIVGYHPQNEDILYIPERDRYSGTYILGVQGVGKSGLLQNLIHADMEGERAVIVIDPHGDLVNACLGFLPGMRVPDTHILDMQDEGYPFGVNIFQTGRLTSSVDVTQAVERLLHIFEVLWPEVVSQQNLPRYVRAAAIVLLANPGSTLVDMYQLLQDQAYRTRLVANVPDLTVQQFWHTQYANLGPHEQYRRVQPLLGRLEALFMGRGLVRNIVGQKVNSIDFRKAIEEKQIILIKLPIKQLKQDARLVGTLLLSQISNAVFSFANVPESQRPGVSLYVDEFQHFATPDFSELLTEGRKFGVRVTVAHQYRNQLPAFLQDSTLTARSKICFQLTTEDSREMSHLFPSSHTTIKPEDVIEHPVHYMLTHQSNDAAIQAFTDMYLHPLHGMKRGAGRIEIELRDKAPRLSDIWNGGRSPNPKVTDPTWQLDQLLYQAMATQTAMLPIPPEIVIGFSNCGQGFFIQAMRLHAGSSCLQPGFRFPPTINRIPETGTEQLHHFLYHLRVVMQRLAVYPIGKATTTTPADVAKMLNQLPRRAAFVRSGDTTGVVYTQDTPQGMDPTTYADVYGYIQDQTRQTYCHPKTEVEQWFMPASPQVTTSAQPLQAEVIE
jgi:hypothetical protein